MNRIKQYGSKTEKLVLTFALGGVALMTSLFVVKKIFDNKKRK